MNAYQTISYASLHSFQATKIMNLEHKKIHLKVQSCKLYNNK